MNKRVLAVVTSHAEYEKSHKKTGLWLSELTHFYDILTQAGYQIDIASTKGGVVPLDPRSLESSYLDASARQFLDGGAHTSLLQNTSPLSETRTEDYVAIFFAGGHGAVWDFKENADIERIVREAQELGIVVSAVCHGVAALVSDIVSGKAVTGFSTLEENLSGKRKEVSYLLETELKRQRGFYSKAWLPFTPYAVADGKLVTGQNPQSTKKVAQLLVKVLEKKIHTRSFANAKCTVCLMGTWVVGLSAVAWGVVASMGGITGEVVSLGFLLGLAGLWFLWFQFPFRPCPRCVAVSRTRDTVG